VDGTFAVEIFFCNRETRETRERVGVLPPDSWCHPAKDFALLAFFAVKKRAVDGTFAVEIVFCNRERRETR
jgi:hypothetical protein